MYIICERKQNIFILVTVTERKACICILSRIQNRVLETLHTGHSNKNIFEELDLFKFRPTGADKTSGKRLFGSFDVPLSRIREPHLESPSLPS